MSIAEKTKGGYLVDMGNAHKYFQRSRPSTATETPLSDKEEIVVRLCEYILQANNPSNGWIPMSKAPKDGSSILLKTNSKASSGYKNIQFIGRYTDDCMEWGFAAPVGVGGFPDEWFDGWWIPDQVFECDRSMGEIGEYTFTPPIIDDASGRN